MNGTPVGMFPVRRLAHRMRHHNASDMPVDRLLETLHQQAESFFGILFKLQHDFVIVDFHLADCGDTLSMTPESQESKIYLC